MASRKDATASCFRPDLARAKPRLKKAGPIELEMRAQGLLSSGQILLQVLQPAEQEPGFCELRMFVHQAQDQRGGLGQTDSRPLTRSRVSTVSRGGAIYLNAIGAPLK